MNYYQNEWAGAFGRKYTDRCQIDYQPRIEIFKKLLIGIKWDNIKSALEIGCNLGHNLRAIADTRIEDSVPLEEPIRIQGIEINPYAIEKSEMKDSIVLGSAYELPWIDNSFDLVLSAGVLIHIPPDSLEKAMKEMYRVSNKFIMMIEYPNEKEVGREYRDFGNKEGVWSRPYGEIFQKLFPESKLIKTGHMKDLGESEWGFTKDCDYWIFSKEK